MAHSIIGIQRRLAEAGRIRIGEKVETTRKDGSKSSRPSRLEEFRLTSQHKAFLDSLAKVYGGKVQEWADAPTGTQWELRTKATSLNVIVPPLEMSFSQSYELWTGGGCRRRCDGVTNSILDAPCVCDPEARECKPHTRLSVMFAELPGSGMWRLDTQGYYALVEMAGAFDLISMVSEATGAKLIKATLRLEQREVKRPDEPTNKFVVPVLSPEFQSFGNELEAPSRGLTPIGAQPASLAEGLMSLSAPTVTRPRANAAEVMPATGLRPPSASGGVVIDAETGEILGEFEPTVDVAALKASVLGQIESIKPIAGLAEILRDEWKRQAIPPVTTTDPDQWKRIAAFVDEFMKDVMLGKHDEQPPTTPAPAESTEREPYDYKFDDEPFERVDSGAPLPPPNKPIEVPASTTTKRAAPSSSVTQKQVGMIHRLCSELGQDAHEAASRITDKTIESLNDLTKSQASKIIDTLMSEKD